MSNLHDAIAEIGDVLTLGGHIREFSIVWSNDGPEPAFTLLVSDDIEEKDSDGHGIPDSITIIACAEARSIPDGLIKLAAALNEAPEAVSAR